MMTVVIYTQYDIHLYNQYEMFYVWILIYLLIVISVPNYCQSVCPKQTTLEEDRELFTKFSSI